MLAPNVVGYHTNDEPRCSKYINEFEMIWSPDVHYLGFGMYFWDNLSNARYWLEEKKRKEPNIDKWAIVRSNISLKNVLDLTDEQVRKSLEQLWLLYCQKKKCNTQAPLGKKIDMLYDFFDNLKLLPVIKASVKYKNKENTMFFGEYVVNYNKIIYSVRSKSEILSREIEEVI